MSARASASSSAAHGTARPPSRAASACAVANVRLAIDDLPDLLRLQVHAGQLGHLAGAEDQHVEPLQVAEDLLRQRDRRVADRHGAFAEAGLGAHALADGERRVNSRLVSAPVTWRSLAFGVRVLDLAEDLRLADDQRIEAGGDAKQVPRGSAPRWTNRCAATSRRAGCRDTR